MKKKVLVVCLIMLGLLIRPIIVERYRGEIAGNLPSDYSYAFSIGIECAGCKEKCLDVSGSYCTSCYMKACKECGGHTYNKNTSYCLTHRCTECYGGPKIGGSNYCAVHKCKSCRLKVVDNDEYCNIHHTHIWNGIKCKCGLCKCSYACNNPVKLKGSLYCSIHTCQKCNGFTPKEGLCTSCTKIISTTPTTPKGYLCKNNPWCKGTVQTYGELCSHCLTHTKETGYVAPTCQKDGRGICSCGGGYIVLNKKPHDQKEVKYKNSGDSEYHYKLFRCSMCEKYYDATGKIEGTTNGTREEHSFKNNECKCGAKKLNTTTCTNDHDPSATGVVSPKCNAYGYKKCPNCPDKYIKVGFSSHYMGEVKNENRNNAEYHYRLYKCYMCNNYYDSQRSPIGDKITHSFENNKCKYCGYIKTTPTASNPPTTTTTPPEKDPLKQTPKEPMYSENGFCLHADCTFMQYEPYDAQVHIARFKCNNEKCNKTVPSYRLHTMNLDKNSGKYICDSCKTECTHPIEKAIYGPFKNTYITEDYISTMWECGLCRQYVFDENNPKYFKNKENLSPIDPPKTNLPKIDPPTTDLPKTDLPKGEDNISKDLETEPNTDSSGYLFNDFISKYKDDPEEINSWAHDSVKNMKELGYLKGHPNYEKGGYDLLPHDDFVTVQLFALMARILEDQGYIVDTSENNVYDLDEVSKVADWAVDDYKYIMEMYGKIYKDKTGEALVKQIFPNQPNWYSKPLTRGEAAALIGTLFGEFNKEQTNFADWNKVPENLKGGISKAIDLEIMAGTKDNKTGIFSIKPDDKLKRLQGVVLLERLYNVLENSKGSNLITQIKQM